MSLTSYIKNTADKVYSRYIRIKEADRHGYCICVTCGVRKHWTEMDAGHYVNRDRKATRYDDMNVHPQCVSCNRFKSGRGSAYAAHLVKRYGEGVILKLDTKSRKVKQYKLGDLKEMVKEWRAEIDKMAIVKNI